MSNYTPLPYAQTLCGNGKVETASQAGSASTMVVPLKVSTTDATKTTMRIDGDTTQELTVPTDETWAFTVQVVGKQTSGESGAYFIRGCIENDGGTVAIIGSNVPDTPMEDTSGWACVVEADNSNNAMDVNVTGAASADVNWTGCAIITRAYNA